MERLLTTQLRSLTIRDFEGSLIPMKTLVLSLLLVIGGACSKEQRATKAAEPDERQQTASASANVALLGRVSDHAEILDSSEEEMLSARLEALENETQHQLVIVSVNSLKGMDIADFTRDLANAWGIGRGGYDDGVVLLVAPNERKVRIAVGLGLEETLPDSLCERIIDEEMLPRFRQSDLAGGVEAGTDALLKALS